MPLLNVVGPEIDALLEHHKKQNWKGPYCGDPVYYKDDNKPDSVRGCFLDELYSKENIVKKLAEKYFDGEVPYMMDHVDDLSEEALDEFMRTYIVKPEPRADRPYHVIFYGVSGYTGSMIMEYLNRECKDDVKVAFAGRTLSKVIATRDRILAGTKWANVDCLAADLKQPFDVEKLVTQCRVVANIAGPFMLTGGECLVEACLTYDTDYVDVSGEIPWTAKLLEFHEAAREAGIYVVPSSAYAGGLPDILTYKATMTCYERFRTPVRKIHAYVEMNAGAQAPSGGTLETRKAMSKASSEKIRNLMRDPFALGGEIQGGNREEDQDNTLSKVFHDKLVKKWCAPHQYAFFETRVVRRSNWLHHQLVGGPYKGYWYGTAFNYTGYAIAKNEQEANASKNSKTSSAAELEALKKAGKLYAAGDGPPLDELLESNAYNVLHIVAESDNGDKVKMSMKGYDGYYETARFVAETAFTLALDSPKLRTGKDHVRGGVLTPAIAGRHVLFDRLVRSGMGFIDWSNDSIMPQAHANFNMIPLKSNADAAE